MELASPKKKFKKEAPLSEEAPKASRINKVYTKSTS